MTVPAAARASPLGPQCAKCRKRRVKCDSTTPGCRRCRRDNHICPGYATRQSTWTIVTPSNISTTVLKPRLKNSSRSSTPKSTSSYDSSSEESIISSTWSPLLPLLTQPSSPSPSEDLTFYQFKDSLAYWTTVMRPSLLACAIPGQPPEMTIDELTSLPRIIQHGLVSVVSGHRLARGHQGHEIVTRLHRHYGLALELLRRYLTDLQMPPGWSMLVLVAMMLGSEASMPANRGRAGWFVHLEAAWTMIQLQGGIVKGIQAGGKGKWNKPGGIEALVRTWKSGVEPALACTHIVTTEIFSVTTCPQRDLVRRPGLKEALSQGALEGLEDRLLLAVSPCPLPVLVMLAEVNDLRLDLYELKQADLQMSESNKDPASDTSNRLWSILTTLLCFDAPAWAAAVYKRHPPNHASLTSYARCDSAAWHRAWAALASAYRSAALIYFVRALQSPRLKSLFPDIYIHFTESTSTVLAAHRRELSENLAFLVPSYAAASPADTALAVVREDPNPNLSRFVSWPLFIDAYEAAAWGEEGSGGGLDKTRRLGRCGRDLGVSCLLDAATTLEELEGKRWPGSPWQWEDAFEQRCIFAV